MTPKDKSFYRAQEKRFLESIGNKKWWANYVKQRNTSTKLKKLGRKQREFKPTKCLITSCTNNSFTISHHYISDILK